MAEFYRLTSSSYYYYYFVYRMNPIDKYYKNTSQTVQFLTIHPVNYLLINTYIMKWILCTPTKHSTKAQNAHGGMILLTQHTGREY